MWWWWWWWLVVVGGDMVYPRRFLQFLGTLVGCLDVLQLFTQLINLPLRLRSCMTRAM